jgi:hypothetical protein
MSRNWALAIEAEEREVGEVFREDLCEATGEAQTSCEL